MREGYPTEDEALYALARYKQLIERGQVKSARRGTPWGPVRWTLEVELR